MSAYETSRLHSIVKDFIQWSLDLEMIASDDGESLDRILGKCQEMGLVDRKDCRRCELYIGEPRNHCIAFATDPLGKYCPCFLREDAT